MRRNLFDCISSLFFLSFIENDSILCMFTKKQKRQIHEQTNVRYFKVYIRRGIY